VAVLLPQALYRFSSLLLRIENPYTQWVWIANPDPRRGDEHPPGREFFPAGNIRRVGSTARCRTSARSGRTSAGSGTPNGTAWNIRWVGTSAGSGYGCNHNHHILCSQQHYQDCLSSKYHDHQESYIYV